MVYNTINTSNTAIISGLLSSDLIKSHSHRGETFYRGIVEVKRLSETVDIIYVIFSERTPSFDKLKKGEFINLYGQFRSRNIHQNEKNILDLYFFANEITILDAELYENEIDLVGYICHKPIYKCAKNNRKVCDLFIAVNRTNNRSDYLPAVAWGRDAYFASQLELGTKIHVIGRIQSREYTKKETNSKGETVELHRIAREISIKTIETINKPIKTTKED